MDLVLVTITGISLVLAIVMGLIVFKLVREERQRSDARVALLEAATRGTSAVGHEPSLELFSSEAAGLSRPDDESIDSSPALFAVAEGESPWPRRVAVAAALALAVAAAGYIVVRDEPAAESSTASDRPLQLIALQHTRDAEALTISGTLRNPRGAAAIADIVAMAFVVGPDGAVIASGRAPLDFRALGPGEESGFLIKIPVQGSVSRYRVGFRRSDGSVVTHVDRRTDGPSARSTGNSENAPWVR